MSTSLQETDRVSENYGGPQVHSEFKTALRILKSHSEF